MKNESTNILIREIEISATKSAIGAIPYVGTLLNEVIFDGRGRIKQERINKFIRMLQEYMESASEEIIDFEYIKSDKFSDIFESILKRVTNIRSEEKMKRFKKILISEMQNPSESDFIEIFLDIVSRLEDMQISILKDIKIATKNCGGLHEKVFKLQNEISFQKTKKNKTLNSLDGNNQIIISEKNNELKKALKILASNQKYYDSSIYNIDQNQYMFYIQDLISKALLQERLIPRYGKEPPVIKIIEISTYGEEFLHFIEDC